MRYMCMFAIGCQLLALPLFGANKAWYEREKDVLSVRNPNPATVPTLSVWQQVCGAYIVSAEFPDASGIVCDSWCYESEVDFVDAKDIGSGVLELRHRSRNYPKLIVITTVTPEPGAVEFVARPEIDGAATGSFPENLEALALNLCWQWMRSAAFQSRPDPYPRFVKRCFMFTDSGRVFLDKTTRLKIPSKPADDNRNNPPWVQMYVGKWQALPAVGPESWAAYSPDRYTCTTIGVVSRDDRHLAALATADAGRMSQAWHDCMHNNPLWKPIVAPLLKQTWRLKMYVTQNDPEALLARVKKDFPAMKEQQSRPSLDYQTAGVKDYLPVIRDRLANRMTFPMSWLSGRYSSFGSWRKAARAKVMECLFTPPPKAPFDPVVTAELDRGAYVAQKLVLSITGDSRVLAYMLVPKGKGPFPAVLLLHDHGARFDIGKEKMIEPWDISAEKLASAKEWVTKLYGGRFIGDELASKGYVCFCTDALNWSDRGGAGYEGQQALGANMIHLGTSLAGLIAHEDLRAAEFLSTCPEVDSKRVAAMGLSMGAFRTCQVTALSDRIAAGAAICWMATAKGLMVPGNNMTKGQSAYAMLHPGLSNYLDYPDVTSLACPKPLLIYNGLQDVLFPVDSVKEAYDTLHRVWSSQHADDRLVTRFWDVPHVFTREMQDEAFKWLDARLALH